MTAYKEECDKSISLTDFSCGLRRIRIRYLDAIKCLGILLVIEGHVRFYGMGKETYDTLSGLMLYSFNMPLFFFVSGFLAYKTKIEYGQVVRCLYKKILLLIIPTFIFFVFRSILRNNNPLDIFTNGAGGYWFTITLWECFVVYYLVSVFIKDNLFRDIVLVILGLSGICFLIVFGNYGPKLLDLNRLSKYFQFFVLGIIAMKYIKRYHRIISCDWLKAISTVSFFAILFTVNNVLLSGIVFHVMRDIILRYLGTFIIVAWFVCHEEIFNANTKLNFYLLDIGQKSLPIYLLQYFFLPDFTTFFPAIDNMDGFTMHFISFSVAFVILACCYVFISLISNSQILKKYVLGRY